MTALQCTEAVKWLAGSPAPRDALDRAGDGTLVFVPALAVSIPVNGAHVRQTDARYSRWV
jgi:hypothetical protein